MADSVKILKSIDSRLEAIQLLLARTPLADILVKPCYTCQEVARLTHSHGIQSYQDFTIRLACSDGRVPEAEKRANRTWSIPVRAVERILQEGLPPERRNGHANPNSTRSH